MTFPSLWGAQSRSHLYLTFRTCLSLFQSFDLKDHFPFCFSSSFLSSWRWIHVLWWFPFIFLCQLTKVYLSHFLFAFMLFPWVFVRDLLDWLLVPGFLVVPSAFCTFISFRALCCFCFLIYWIDLLRCHFLLYFHFFTGNALGKSACPQLLKLFSAYFPLIISGCDNMLAILWFRKNIKNNK